MDAAAHFLLICLNFLKPINTSSAFSILLHFLFPAMFTLAAPSHLSHCLLLSSFRFPHSPFHSPHSPFSVPSPFLLKTLSPHLFPVLALCLIQSHFPFFFSLPPPLLPPLSLPPPFKPSSPYSFTPSYTNPQKLPIQTPHK